MTPTDTPRRYITVVYEIIDENEWRKTNPRRYAHNGLSAVRVCVDDACELLDQAKAELEEIKETYASIVQQPHFDEREVHCSCVSALRAEVERLRAINADMRNFLAKALHNEGFNEDQALKFIYQ